MSRERFRITFTYRDGYSFPKWNTQSCEMGSVEECIKWYGLGKDCEFEIISIEKIIEEKEE